MNSARIGLQWSFVVNQARVVVAVVVDEVGAPETMGVLNFHYQDIFAAQVSGQTEVPAGDGTRCDILIDSCAIEVA